MAPEQVRGQAERVDGRTDLWALGAILYELLTGRPPFTGTDAELREQILSRDPRPPRQWVETIPPPVEALELKLLSKEQAIRPPSAGEVAEQLRLCLREVESVPIVDGMAGTVSSRSLTAVVVAAIAMVAMLSLVVIVWILGSGGSPAAIPRDPEPARSKYAADVWTPLLEAEPRAIRLANSATAVYKPGRASVTSEYLTLLELGEIDAKAYSIRVTVESKWEGDAGLFVGFRPSLNGSVDECAVVAICKRASGKLFIQPSRMSLEREGIQRPAVFDYSAGSTMRFDRSPTEPATLQVDVADGQVVEVFYNDVAVPFPSTRPGSPLVHAGKFGVYLQHGSANFSKASIRVKQLE
jgi:hypothetical protein